MASVAGEGKAGPCPRLPHSPPPISPPASPSSGSYMPTSPRMASLKYVPTPPPHDGRIGSPKRTPSQSSSEARLGSPRSSPLKRYKLVKRMGNTAYLVNDLQDNGELKILRRVDLYNVKPDRRGALSQELEKLAVLLNHQHLVRILHTFQHEESMFIITEYCEGGSLHNLIARAKNEGELLNEIEVLDWFVQMLLALQHLHGRQVVHQLFVSGNIFLKSNTVKIGEVPGLKSLYENPLAVVGDGDALHTSAWAFEPAQLPSRKDGVEETIFYTSPECANGHALTEKSNMWSLGCVLYEMCAQRRTFRGENGVEVLTNIIKEDLPTFPESFPEVLKDTWKRLMEKDPEKRLLASQVLEIPFIASHNEDMQESMRQVKANRQESPPRDQSNEELSAKLETCSLDHSSDVYESEEDLQLPESDTDKSTDNNT